MSNNQIHRMLRKRLAASKIHTEQLQQRMVYVLGFVQFIAHSGVDVVELEKKYREHIEQQAQA